MPFCRTRLSAKRFIAGVGGYAAAPLPLTAPSKDDPPAAMPSFSLPMMRSGDIAHGVDRADHLLLTDNHIVEQAFKLRRHARVDQCRIGLLKDAEQRQPGLGRHDVLSLDDQKALFLQPADDLGSSRGRADALGFLQAFSQHLIVNEPPGILHRFDQRAFVVPRRWPVSLSSIFGSCRCAVSPLRSGGSNCASSPFSSAGCHSGNTARQPRSMG